MKVCVFGTYKDLGKEAKDEVALLGRLLAEKGITVVSGGFSGVMEDVSRGAKEAGGKTVGVTYYKEGSTKGKRANPFIDEEMIAKDIFERIRTMIDISDGFVVLKGGTGTLLELAAVLEHINKDMITPKPLVAIGDFWKGVSENLKEEKLLSAEAAEKLGVSDCGGLIYFANGAEDAVRKLTESL